jgi:hypothetical protein
MAGSGLELLSPEKGTVKWEPGGLLPVIDGCIFFSQQMKD